MNDAERVARWLVDLTAALDQGAALIARGEDTYRTDAALALAFEALCSRVGELAKRLRQADPARFREPIWVQAARNRDFVVHYYDRIDLELLWRTVAVDFPRLRKAMRAAEAG